MIKALQVHVTCIDSTLSVYCHQCHVIICIFREECYVDVVLCMHNTPFRYERKYALRHLIKHLACIRSSFKLRPPHLCHCCNVNLARILNCVQAHSCRIFKNSSLLSTLCKLLRSI